MNEQNQNADIQDLLTRAIEALDEEDWSCCAQLALAACKLVEEQVLREESEQEDPQT